MAYNYSIARLGHPTISKSDYEQMVSTIQSTLCGFQVCGWLQEAAWPQCHQMITKCQTDTQSCAAAQSYCNEAMLAAYEESGLLQLDLQHG
jgi:hypothetical protein